MKKILNILLGLLFVGLSAQTTAVPSGVSTTENYVYSRTYLEAVTASDSTAKQVQGIQYFDGLGRPKQSIAIKASPLGRDVVTPIVYDDFGRQTRDYLPIPQSSTTNGTIYTQSTGLVNYPVSDPTNIYSSEKIYSEKVLESSPLDRVLQQVQVGNDWSSKPIKFDYLTNVGDAVKKYTITTTWSVANTDIYTTTSSLPVISTYADNTLYKNKVTDEDGNESYEFKNGQGQTILVRKVLSATESADTYYVYNEYDQLALVIPPLASVKATLLQSDLDELCYQYRYDNQNRLVEKKLPGKGWEFVVYDKQDRLVLTQDAMLRGTTNNFAKRGWLFTKYDQFGRVVYTGFFANTATRETMQKSLNSMNSSNNESRSSTGFSQNGLTVYYTKVAFPTGSMTILSVNYYDQYPTDLVTIPTAIQGESLLTTAPQTTEQRSLKSLAVASFVKNIDTDSWTKSYSFYDLKGRAIGSHSYNYLGGYTKAESKLDFAGVPQESYTYHKRLSTDTEIIIKERFEYDGQNRMVKHYHQVDANPEELLANNEYNELGQLKNKKVGGLATAAIPLQTVDYQYNIRGWMTQINDPANLGNDLFGFEIKYQNPDTGKSSPIAKYNGNISQTTWATKNDEIIRTYTYQYDKLNRLTDARLWDQMNLDIGEYQENLTYDLNGNISTLYRTGAYPYSGATAPETMDDLQYNYASNTNKLTTLKEKGTGNVQSGYPLAAGQTGQIITYDNNGNMISQGDKGITTIKYNYLNLPTEIIGTESIYASNGVPTTYNVTTKYTYNAAGEKLKKEYTYFDRSNYYYKTISTDYLNGFQYEGGRDSQFSAVKLKFFPTAEGYVTNNQPIYESGQNLNNISYIYQYKDHLVNARVSYANSYYITEENNYYPFGLKHIGYNNDGGSPTYQYKYNGKELQETGMYDYGARFYMPDIGRWGVVDPLAEKMRRHSVYNYAFDNPIRWIDPDGRGPTDVIITGNYKQEYLAQMQARASNLNLSMDNNGKLTGSVKEGSTATAAEQKLLAATNDHTIIVNMNTTDSNTTKDSNGQNQLMLGGQYGGNHTTGVGIDSSLEGSPSKITIANQTYNPMTDEKIDDAAGLTKGTGAMHETLEAIEGAVIAQTTGVDGSAESTYNQAHDTVNTFPESNTNFDISKLQILVYPQNSDGSRKIEVKLNNKEIFTLPNYIK